MRRQGLMMLWVAIAAAMVWAVPASATVVTAQSDGTVTLTAETSAAAGGSGISSIGVWHGGTQQAPDEGHIVFSVMGPLGTPFESIEKLKLAPGSASWCTEQISGAFVLSITCDTDEIDSISASLGDGNDFLLAQSITRIGNHVPNGPANDVAMVVDLGAGNDSFYGSSLTERVYDGPGSDNLQMYTPTGGSGHDRVIQPDVANPALEDSGDKLDTDYKSGVVDYGARTGGTGVVVSARDWASNDGAPGENDIVTAYGVRGTEFADEITAGITNEEFIAFDLSGGGGDDVIKGGAGADRLDGGGGDDEITGDIGADEISGGQGDDEIEENDGNPDGSIACGTGADTVNADPAGVDDDIEPPGAAGAGCETVTRTALPPLDTTITGGPGPVTNDATPTVEFESDEPRAWFECSLDGGPWTYCGSPLTAPDPLADGPHELRVRSGWGVRTDPTPAQLTTIIDTGAPQTTVLPPALPEGGVLAKTWSSDEAGSTFRCSIDGELPVDCTSSLSVAGVSVGEHALAVHAVDAAGNADPTPATTTFRVPGKPTVSISAGPATGHRNEDVAFTATAAPASAGDPAPALAWELDGDGDFNDGTGTTATARFTSLGAKTVKVRATNAGGEATAERSVTIVNRAASCSAVSRRTAFGAAVSVPLTCTDADGDPLTLSKASDPAHGSLGAIAGGAVTYTPAAGYSGPDSFTYRANDGTADSAPATVSLTVDPKPVDPGTGTTGGGTTGGGTTGDGTTASGTTDGGTPPPAADTKPPVATMTPAKRQALAKVLGKGLALAIKLDEAGTVKVTLTVDAATARKLKLAPKAKKPVVIGTLTRPLGAGGGSVTVKLTAKARKALKKAKTVKVALAVEATDAAGNRSKRTGSATLKR